MLAGRDPELQAPRRVTFLVQNSYGSGGIARTIANLANALAATHHVEVLSMFRWRATPHFPLHPSIVDTVLFDYGGTRRTPPRPREDPQADPARRRLDARPSVLYDGGRAKSAPVSALTDRALRRRLATLRPGVLISTRPSLHLAAARWSPPWVLRVAQDHLNYPARTRDPRMIGTLDEASRRLDAFVTLTHDDRRDYATRWGGGSRRLRVERIPNASPFVPTHRSGPDPKVVVSAGRLEPRKGFGRVIEAFAAVSRDFPDWRLEIYGRGPAQPKLESIVEELGVHDQVRLCGYTSSFDEVLARSSVYALGSHHEGLPMVLLEAQATGLPVVAFDCPRGPADLVHDGIDGRLVEDGDLAGFASALREIMGDAELREGMGERGRQNAEHYRIEAVVDQWERLFGELARARPRPLRVVLRPARRTPRRRPSGSPGSRRPPVRTPVHATHDGVGSA